MTRRLRRSVRGRLRRLAVVGAAPNLLIDELVRRDAEELLVRLGLVLEPVIDVELGHSTRAYRALD